MLCIQLQTLRRSFSYWYYQMTRLLGYYNRTHNGDPDPAALHGRADNLVQGSPSPISPNPERSNKLPYVHMYVHVCPDKAKHRSIRSIQQLLDTETGSDMHNLHVTRTMESTDTLENVSCPARDPWYPPRGDESMLLR